MLSRNACYAKSNNVVLRRFEEWGRCYAFTPDEPEIYDLNTTAWFIVELCDGRPFQQIESDYVATVGPKIGRDEARVQIHTGFDTLLRQNIISARE